MIKIPNELKELMKIILVTALFSLPLLTIFTRFRVVGFIYAIIFVYILVVKTDMGV